MSNSYIICIIIILGLLAFFASSFKVTKVSVKFSDLDEEQQKKLRKTRPVACWRARLGNSFEQYSNGMKELINWWRDHEEYIKNGFDSVTVKLVAQASVGLFNDTVDKLTKINLFTTFFKLKLQGEEKLTKKIFGKDINNLYYYMNVLKYGKENLESQTNEGKFEVIFTDELLEKALNNSKVN